MDSVINQGLPAPIDVQVSSNNMHGAFELAQKCAQKIKALPNVSDVYIPQDLDYPGLALNIDRERASLIGLSAQGRSEQRNYRSDFRWNGGADLLDRPQDRQQLHGNRSIRQPCAQSHDDGGL